MKKELMEKPTGNFGNMVKQYEATRPSYPAKVISFISSNLSHIKPLILDIGCGTGISTRQLGEKIKGAIIGCDIDLEMLKSAISSPQKNISYSLGDARKIPYAKETFDMVTAFTAFHWFKDEVALKEIRRVLKTSGKLCTVQPRHVSTFSEDFRVILQRELKRVLPPARSHLDFQESLQKARYKDIQKKIVKDIQIYTLDQYLTLLQSRSVWNNAPLSERKRILGILTKHFAKKLEKGVIYDTLEIEVLIASA